ncbi:transposase [Candidatus Woesearchaeota archaeon]|nr:transposase [Candidatus Woesearchaeota archaeon]
MKQFKPKPGYDGYEDLNRVSRNIYKNVSPASSDVQSRLTQYTPKPFGEKRTYGQEWSIYEKACSQEKLMFFRILKDAVDFLMIDYEYCGNGRPPVYTADIVKSLCIKSYNNYSSWRAESELKIARAMGIITEVYRRSTLNKYMQDPKVRKLLHKLYKIIAQPLAEVEVYFSADATGISNKYGNTRWMQIRHTKEEAKHRREYSKLHIITGNKTNCICSAKVTKGTAHESPFFKPLLDDTCKIFNVKEVSADAGYLSRDNVKAISDANAVPFIMPKKNVNVPRRGSISEWGGMLRLWKEHQMFFAEHYHKRSNVESTFGMMKRKFGDFCRSKKPESQENEILCKIVCHNVAVLAEALLSYDLKSGFIASL